MKNNLNTQNINYYYLENDYNKIINELDDDYIAQFNQIKEYEILKEFKNIDENFIELEYKINFSSEKYLKYITNFEIVDKDIKDFFIKNNIAKKEHFISLKSYKCDNGKILIIFEKNNNNFYEIGYFNENEDFIIEYLIDELENINNYYITNYFYYHGLSSFIKYDFKESENIINLDYRTKKICYYYKIGEINKPKLQEKFQTHNLFRINNNNNFDIKDKLNFENNLINKNNIKEQNKNKNKELNINNNKVNKYLSYLIIIHNEYSKIKKKYLKKILYNQMDQKKNII